MRLHAAVIAPVVGLAFAGATLAFSTATMIEVEGEGAKYWTRWRGPSGQGIVDTGKYRDKWSPTEGVKWKVPVPGRGHSSPIVWGDHIFFTTEYDNGARLSMLAFRRSDGKKLWETFVPTEGVEHVYPKNSRASATPVTDGALVYGSFGTHGLAAFDFSGKMVWHNRVGRLNNYHGSAGSPILYKDRVIIYQDHKGSEETTAYVGAFDKKTGKQVWKTPRVETVGWGTPIVVRAGDRDELIVSSQRKVYGYDPDTGKELWTVAGLSFEVIPTPVVAEGLVLCSSGRQGPTIAIRPGGSGDLTGTDRIVWTYEKGTAYVSSPILYGDHIYLTNDQGILTCLDAKSGKVVYEGGRVPAPAMFFASMVAYDGMLLQSSEDGDMFLVKAGPTHEIVRTNSIGEPLYASPAIANGRIYVRGLNHVFAFGAGG